MRHVRSHSNCRMREEIANGSSRPFASLSEAVREGAAILRQCYKENGVSGETWAFCKAKQLRNIVLLFFHHHKKTV